MHTPSLLVVERRGPFLYYPSECVQASGAPAMFTIGLEYTDLLVDVLRAAPAPASDSGDRRSRVAARLAACVAAVDAHLRVLAEVATRVASARGIAFGGLDASAAPSKDCASITDVFALLGVPAFGAAGTLEAAALLTRGIFRALGDGIMPRAGFSGLSASPPAPVPLVTEGERGGKCK